jgi:regulator of replication initiation timing
MEEKLVKEAFESAEKELRDKRIVEVKAIVLKTLEKLSDVEKIIKEKQEEKKILKMDIDDLKEGRLDRIAERQTIDEKAKKVSVVVIIKEKETIREVSPWYYPYQVIWQVPYVPTYYNNTVKLCGGNNTLLLNTASEINSSNTYGSSNFTSTTINCSVAKDATIGAYDINGHIVNLR